jgi:hypothetical protein
LKKSIDIFQENCEALQHNVDDILKYCQSVQEFKDNKALNRLTQIKTEVEELLGEMIPILKISQNSIVWMVREYRHQLREQLRGGKQNVIKSTAERSVPEEKSAPKPPPPKFPKPTKSPKHPKLDHMTPAIVRVTAAVSRKEQLLREKQNVIKSTTDRRVLEKKSAPKPPPPKFPKPTKSPKHPKLDHMTPAIVRVTAAVSRKEQLLREKQNVISSRQQPLDQLFAEIERAVLVDMLNLMFVHIKMRLNEVKQYPNHPFKIIKNQGGVLEDVESESDIIDCFFQDIFPSQKAKIDIDKMPTDIVGALTVAYINSLEQVNLYLDNKKRLNESSTHTHHQKKKHLKKRRKNNSAKKHNRKKRTVEIATKETKKTVKKIEEPGTVDDIQVFQQQNTEMPTDELRSYFDEFVCALDQQELITHEIRENLNLVDEKYSELRDKSGNSIQIILRSMEQYKELSLMQHKMKELQHQLDAALKVKRSVSEWPPENNLNISSKLIDAEEHMQTIIEKKNEFGVVIKNTILRHDGKIIPSMLSELQEFEQDMSQRFDDWQKDLDQSNLENNPLNFEENVEGVFDKETLKSNRQTLNDKIKGIDSDRESNRKTLQNLPTSTTKTTGFTLAVKKLLRSEAVSFTKRQKDIRRNINKATIQHAQIQNELSCCDCIEQSINIKASVMALQKDSLTEWIKNIGVALENVKKTLVERKWDLSFFKGGAESYLRKISFIQHTLNMFVNSLIVQKKQVGTHIQKIENCIKTVKANILNTLRLKDLSFENKKTWQKYCSKMLKQDARVLGYLEKRLKIAKTILSAVKDDYSMLGNLIKLNRMLEEHQYTVKSSGAYARQQLERVRLRVSALIIGTKRIEKTLQQSRHELKVFDQQQNLKKTKQETEKSTNTMKNSANNALSQDNFTPPSLLDSDIQALEGIESNIDPNEDDDISDTKKDDNCGGSVEIIDKSPAAILIPKNNIEFRRCNHDISGSKEMRQTQDSENIFWHTLCRIFRWILSCFLSFQDALDSEHNKSDHVEDGKVSDLSSKPGVKEAVAVVLSQSTLPNPKGPMSRAVVAEPGKKDNTVNRKKQTVSQNQGDPPSNWRSFT